MRALPRLLAVVVTAALPFAVPGSFASSAVTPPPAAARFSYQIGGAYTPAPGVQIVDRDRTDRPAAGLYNVCYVNAFQAQPGSLRWWRTHHPGLLLRDHGRLVVDTGWNEPLLDTSTAARRRALAGVVGGWMSGCAKAGYDAVEPDNLDSYTRSHHLLTSADALAYSRLLIARAHADGLAIAQKNAADLSARGRSAGFDFAIAEECQVWSECGSYTAAYGDEVIEVEYADQPVRFFTRACDARGSTISITRRDRDVLPAGQRGHVEQWCP